MSSPDEILATIGVRPSRRRGQHFLVDERVAERLVGYAALTKQDRVLEIGAGLGTLTAFIAPRVGDLIALENDPRLCGYLRSIGFEVVCADALRVQLPAFDKVVSNLPYSISSQITFKLLSQGFKMGVLMYQVEFAERMIAKPGTEAYSRLSVMVQHKAEVEVLERVPRSAFHPQPKVDSTIVKLVPRTPSYHVDDEDLFASLVRILFSHRRKKISTTLSMKAGLLRVPMDMALHAARTLGVSEARVEVLSPSELAALANALFHLRRRSME